MQPYEEDYLKEKYRHQDERGIFQDISLTGAEIRNGDSGRVWKGFNPNSIGRHWSVPRELAKYIQNFSALNTQQKLDALESKNLIYWPKKKNGEDSFPRVKQYAGDGIGIQDCIFDIKALNSQAQERMGYPTQKPVALLERIITASSNPGDVVLDPFCGCGTTVHAAQKLKRRWVGIDITPLAINLIARRLKDAFIGVSYDIRGIPHDMDGAHALFARDRHLFQLWATDLIAAQPYRDGKKGADGGIDGMIYFKPDSRVTKAAIVSVKGGMNREVSHIRDLRGTIERLQEPMGVFVTLHPPTEPMRREAASAGLYDTGTQKVSRIQIVTIEEALKLRDRAVQIPFGHSTSFKQAPREKAAPKVTDLFGSEPEKHKQSRKKLPSPSPSIPSSAIAAKAMRDLMGDGEVNPQ